MTLQTRDGNARPVRHRGAGPLGLAGTVIVLGMALAGLAQPQPAAAADLTITTPAETLFDSHSVTITGTRDGAHAIELAANGTPVCTAPPGGESWACTMELPDGPTTITATTTADDSIDNESAAASTASVAIRVLGAPTIDDATELGMLTGTGLAGAGIVITAEGPESLSTECTTVLVPDGTWGCPLPVHTSGEYTITAQQTWPGSGEPGGTSGPITVTLDKDPPAAPEVTSPEAGATVDAQPATYAGTGGTGARVDVFGDGALLCSTTVVARAWSCTGGGLPSGEHGIQAIQWDAAGNASAPSAPITVTFATDAPSAPVTPAQPDQPPSPTTPTLPAPDAGPAIPLIPPPVGGESGLPPGETWDLPTDYGAAIPSASTAALDGGWLASLAFGIGFVGLVALPLRLALGAVRDRLPRRSPDEPRADPPLLSPQVTIAAALTAAAVLAALASGIQAEVRYLRLVIAITVALAIVNGVGVALAARVAGRSAGVAAGIRLVPFLLGTAAVSALLSRVAGIQPPIVLGVVVAAVLAGGLTRRGRGVVSLVQLATMTALGLGGWLAQGAMGPVEGFWPSLLSESLAALCLAALGSMLVLTLPVGGLPGHHLFEWSRPLWAGVAVAGSAFAAAVIARSASFPLPAAAGVALTFAAVCLAVWSWARFVQPQLVSR